MNKVKIFNSMEDAFEYLDEEEHFGLKNNKRCRQMMKEFKTDRSNWYECESFDAYKDKYFSSDSGKLNIFKEGPAPIPKTDTTGEKLKMKKGLYGNPIVPRVVMGHPINSRRLVKQQSPSYIVVINMNYRGDTSVQEMMTNNMKAIGQFLALEGNKRLFISSANENYGTFLYDDGTTQKESGARTMVGQVVMIDITKEIANLARLLFILGSPDTSRRLFLGLKERHRAVELFPKRGTDWCDLTIADTDIIKKEVQYALQGREVVLIDAQNL